MRYFVFGVKFRDFGSAILIFVAVVRFRNEDPSRPEGVDR